MKRTEFEAKYWNYYQHIESKFMNVSSFVYFDKANFNVYSYEFVRYEQAPSDVQEAEIAKRAKEE